MIIRSIIATQVAVLVGLCAGAAQISNAQHSSEIGLPFITNYGPRDYDAGSFNWGITQDQRGIMYFANEQGVLEFDGTEWRLIELSNRSTARSIAAANDGRIYVGGVRELGYLAPDSTGMMAFVSLLPELPEEHREFTDVWHTYAMPDGVYFMTDDKVMRFSEAGAKVWKSSTSLHVGFQVGDTLYIREWGTGLMRVDPDSLRLVPGGDAFTQERIYVMLPYDDGRAIVVTRTMGVFLFDGRTFEPFETEVDEFLAEHLIYLPGATLRDGGYAFPSISGGVAIMNKDGSLRQVIDQSSGIPDNGIVFTYEDMAGDLWLGAAVGISRVEIGSPYSVFDVRNGFASQLTDVIRYEGDLFASSQSGFYRFDRSDRRWNGVPGTNNQTFTMEVVAGRLLIGSGLEGLYEYKDGELNSVKNAVDNSFSVGLVQKSQFDSTRIFLGLLGGVGSVRLDSAGAWIDEGVLPDYNWTRFSLVEESEGVVWVGGPDGPPVKVAFSIRDGNIQWDQADVVTYGADKGGSDTGGGVFKIGDQLYSSSDEDWIRYDAATDSFVDAPELNAIRIRRTGGGFNVDDAGRYWINGGWNIAVVESTSNGSLKIDAGRFNSIAELAPGAMLPETDGVTWIVTLDGLVRYDSHVDQSKASNVSALIRRVSVSGDSLIYAGSTPPDATELPYNRNSIRFSYSSSNYQGLDLNRFQTRLAGFETAFTEWTPDTRREFTNLNPGEYEFQVLTRTAAGVRSSPASYPFSILPPWYSTWWAFLLYALASAGLVIGFVGVRTRQLKIRHRELENTVEDRTAEINQRVEELAVINSVQDGLAAEMDIQGIYDLVGDRIRDLFDAQVVVIRTFDRENDLEVFNYAIEKGERLVVDSRPIVGLTKHLSEHRDVIVLNKNYLDYYNRYDDRRTPAGEAPKSVLYVPLVVGDSVKGNVSLQNIDRENAFPQSDVRLLTTLANSMSVALENARLFDQTTHLLAEAGQRAEELSTVNRIGKALVAQLEFDALIQLIGSSIQELFKADMAYVALHDRETNMISFPYGYGDEFPPMEFGEGFTTQIIQTGRPLLINDDVRGSFAEMGIEEIGKSSASYLGVPISLSSGVIGVISVQSASESGIFDADDQRLMSTIATNVGVALQNAEAYRKLNKTLSDLKSTQEQLVTQEKMASLGQLTAGIAHEIKNPLNFVNNFAELISELAKEAGDLFEHSRAEIPDELAAEIIPMLAGLSVNAQQVHKHGKRADGIVKNMMDHATGGSGERYRVEVNPFVEEYMQLAYHGVRAQTPDLDVSMTKEFDPAVGTLDMAPRDIGRVVVNLVNNALYAVNERARGESDDYRPEVTVGTMKHNGSILITVADNGSGIPDDVREKIFEPLFTTKPTGSGTGLGLSLSFDIVTQAHGGRLDFETRQGDGTTFTVTLPSH
jgi:signal transduction histidine kinase